MLFWTQNSADFNKNFDLAGAVIILFCNISSSIARNAKNAKITPRTLKIMMFKSTATFWSKLQILFVNGNIW